MDGDALLLMLLVGDLVRFGDGGGGIATPLGIRLLEAGFGVANGEDGVPPTFEVELLGDDTLLAMPLGEPKPIELGDEIFCGELRSSVAVMPAYLLALVPGVGVTVLRLFLGRRLADVSVGTAGFLV